MRQRYRERADGQARKAAREGEVKGAVRLQEDMREWRTNGMVVERAKGRAGSLVRKADTCQRLSCNTYVLQPPFEDGGRKA